MSDVAVPLILSPEPFSRSVAHLSQPAGRTIRAALADAVRTGALAIDDLPRTIVYVDGERLERAKTLDHVLREGETVNVVVEPLGGGGRGKDIGQILLSIAVIAVSAWVGGPAGPLAAMSALTRTVAAAAVMTLGQAGVAALFAPDIKGQAKANDRYALQNASNQFRPWAPFPLALGEVVAAPDFAVKTFTRSIGDDVWLYGILGVHFGPCEISEMKIGDTLVSSMGAGDFMKVEHLTPGPRAFSLCPNDVNQTDFQEQLEATTSGATAIVRAGDGEGERFEFDFFLPAGLHFQKDDGRVIAAAVSVTIRYRPIDEDGVPTGSGTWTNGLTVSLSSTTKEPWRVTRNLALPMGRYEFEFKRSVKPDGNEKRRDTILLTAVRAIAFRKPIMDETLSVVEFAVRATALNQGTLAPITCRIKPLYETWDAGAGAWTAPVATSNPAALMRGLLTGPAAARPLAPEQADMQLRAWSELCDAYDWKAGIYLLEERTQAEVVAMLDQAGRASTFWDGTQIVASPWVEKPAPRQIFTGANLRDHRWTIDFPEPVHALRVEFQNIDEAGEPDELYVYADGYAETANPEQSVEAATLIEVLRLEGQKTAERAYRDGRWELGRRKHQRRIDTWTADAENLVSRYGDRVRLAWQRVDGGVGARVRCRRWAGELVSGLRLDQPVEMRPGESYAVDLRLAGDSVRTAVAVINPAVDEPVATREIQFAAPRAPAETPARGGLLAFGVATRVSEDVELIGIEPGEDLSAVLTGVRYVAPLLMAGETGPIPELQTRLTRQRAASPPAPRLLGVQPDPAGVRVSFDMPPWAGSPITGFSARWRPTPPAGLETGWQSLPALAADARVLLVPSPRALPSAPGDEEGATRIDVELRAITAAGQTSPVPMTLSGQEVREDPFAPTNLTVTPATRTAPGGSSHGVLVVSADALAAAQGVEMVLEVRRYPPEGGAPDAWESAGLALAAANPVGDILGLRSGTQYGVRGAWRSAAGWPSVWTEEVTATVPAGSNVSDDVVNIGDRPVVDVLAMVDATKQKADDLETVYGDTASAAQSAADAAAASAAAVLAKADAVQAKDDAVSAAGASASSASQAGGYVTDAETAAAASSAARVGAEAAYGATVLVEGNQDFAQGLSGWTFEAPTASPYVIDYAGRSDVLLSESYSIVATNARRVPIRAGRVYEAAAELLAGSGTGTSFLSYFGVRCFDDVGTFLGNAYPLAYGLERAADSGWYEVPAVTFGIADLFPGTVEVQQYVQINYDGAAVGVGLNFYTLLDVTERDAARQQAEASAASASTASAKAGEAATSAAAAESDRLAAETARSEADAARSLAVQAQEDAESAAATAAAQQTLAATAKTDAEAAAAASAGSASLASSKADEAATYAAAASAERVAAEAARDDASADAASAATQAATATAKASEAGDHAASALAASTTATTKAGEALTYAEQSASSRDDSVEAKTSAEAAAVTAGSHAATSQSAAASASADAARAEESSYLAAQLGQAAINENPVFADWENGSYNSPPGAYTLVASGSVSVNRVTGSAPSPYAAELINDNASDTLRLASTPVAGGEGYYVAELDFTLLWGSLGGLGLTVRGDISGGSFVHEAHLTAVNEIPSPTSGRRYVIGTVLQLVGATIEQTRLLVHGNGLQNYGGVGGASAKGVLVHRACYRPATEGEIASGMAAAQIGATVAEQSQALIDLETGKAEASDLSATNATLAALSSETAILQSSMIDAQTKLATGRIVLNAAATGGRPARLGLYSDNHGGSVVALDAAEIWFGDNTVFDDATNTLRTTVGSNIRYIALGAPIGASGDLLEWFGPSATAFASIEKTNGLRAFTTAGRTYVEGRRQDVLYTETASSGAVNISSVTMTDMLTLTLSQAVALVDLFRVAGGADIISPTPRTRSSSGTESPSGDWEIWELPASGTIGERKVASGTWAATIIGTGGSPANVTEINMGTTGDNWSDVSREWRFKHGGLERFVLRMRKNTAASLLDVNLNLRASIQKYA